MNTVKAKINFYRSLATMLEAGVPVTRILRHRFPGPFTAAAERMADMIENEGGSLADSTALVPTLIQPYEQRLIRAGEQTGRLEFVLRTLAERHEQQYKTKKNIINQLIYPLFLYHFAAIAIPLIKWLIAGGSLHRAVVRILFMTALPYIIYFCGKLLLHLSAALSERGYSPADILLLHTPIIGKLIRQSNYEAFFSALHLAADAGMKMSDAVKLGASVCKNCTVKYAFERAGEMIDTENCRLTEAIRTFIFAADRHAPMMSILETGEMSGKTAEISATIARNCREETAAVMALIANLVPKVIYLCIMIYVAVMILQFYGNIIRRTTSLG